MESSKTFKCLCGKAYTQHQSLYRHHKTCEVFLNDKNIKTITVQTSLYEELKEQNNMLIQENKVLQEQIKSFNEQKILQDQLKSLTVTIKLKNYFN